jgi:hypothetical protein
VVGYQIIPDDSSERKIVKNTMDDEYHFFSFAIIWGKFEILKFNEFWGGLYVYNSDPNYNTLHIIGYVGYNGVGFIYGNYSGISCPWRLGIVLQHRLFVIGWGVSVMAW